MAVTKSYSVVEKATFNPPGHFTVETLGLSGGNILSTGVYVPGGQQPNSTGIATYRSTDGAFVNSGNGFFGNVYALAQMTNGNIAAVGTYSNQAYLFIYTPSLTNTTPNGIPFGNQGGIGDRGPDVAALKGPNGGMVVVYTDPNLKGIHFQILTAAGGFVSEGAPDTTSSIAERPSVAALDDGGFAIAWNRSLPVSGDTQLWYAVYNSDGSIRRAPMLFDPDGTINRDASLTALASGGFAMVYEDNETQVSTIDIDLFDASGSLRDSDFLGLTLTGRNSDASVTTLSNGWVLVTYTNNYQGTGDLDIRAALIDQSSGSISIVADAISIATTSSFREAQSSVTALPGGRFAVGYGTLNTSNVATGPVEKIFQLVRNTSSDGASDTLVGDDYIDIMFGGGGNDTMNGGANIDTAIFTGNRSAYTITAVAGGRQVSGPDGTDTLTNIEKLSFSNVTVPLLHSDFNADFSSDILLQNVNSGAVHLWLMGGTSLVGNGAAGWTPGGNWQAKTIGDYNGDGSSDILLQNVTSGACFIWQLNGTSLVGSGAVGWVPGGNWQAKSSGDFNGDGRSDVLLQDATNGNCFIWELNGTTLLGSRAVGWSPGAEWQAKATGDFNGDGYSDILLQNVNNGACYIWELNGTGLVGSGAVGWVPGANWQARTTGDYNGDGRSDILLQNADTGGCFIWLMNGTSLVGSGAVGWVPGAEWRAKSDGDYNADGKSDILLQNVNSGAAHMWLVDGTTLIGNSSVGWVPGADWHIV